MRKLVCAALAVTATLAGPAGAEKRVVETATGSCGAEWVLVAGRFKPDGPAKLIVLRRDRFDHLIPGPTCVANYVGLNNESQAIYFEESVGLFLARCLLWGEDAQRVRPAR